MGMPVSALQFVLPLIVAAVLVYRRRRWRGVASLLRRTVSPSGSAHPRWWLVAVIPAAVFLVPVLMAVTYGSSFLLGGPPQGAHSPLSAVPVLLLLYLVSAGFEEAGWTGYVLEPLRNRWGPLVAGLIIGGVWAVWHLVGFVQGDRSALWIVGQCLSTVAIRVLMVWLFDASGGIVLTAVVVHALVNVTQSIFPGFPQQAAPALLFGLVSAIAAFIVAGTWLARERKQGSGISPGSGRT